MEKQEKTRDTKIDITKGILIFLMVVAHTSCPKLLGKTIYSFHMPMFVMLSGYLFSESAFEDRKVVCKYIKKKFLSLYVPYVKWHLFYLLLNNLFMKDGLYTSDSRLLEIEIAGNSWGLQKYLELKEIVINLIKTFVGMYSTQMGGALWFLVCLFGISVGSIVCFYVLRRFGLTYKKIIYLMFAFSLVTELTIVIGNFNIFMAIKECINFLPAYYLGMIFKLHKISSNKACMCISLLALILLNIYWNSSFEILYVITCTLAWFVLYGLADAISETRMAEPFAYLGKNTMPIIAMHFLAFKIVSYLYIVVSGEDMLLLASFPTIKVPNLWIMYTIVGIAVPLFINALWNRCNELIKTCRLKQKNI